MYKKAGKMLQLGREGRGSISDAGKHTYVMTGPGPIKKRRRAAKQARAAEAARKKREEEKAKQAEWQKRLDEARACERERRRVRNLRSKIRESLLSKRRFNVTSGR
jgi:hypothetical protein